MPESGHRDHRTKIANVVHRYAYYIRTQQAAKVADLFTEDAVFEVRSVNPLDLRNVQVRRTLTGRQAISDYVIKAEGYGIHVCPLIFNLLIEIDGDTATSNAVMESRTWPAGHEVIGEYDDSFRGEPDGCFSRGCLPFGPADGYWPAYPIAE